MSTPEVRYESRGEVAVVTICRPRSLNAINSAVLDGLAAAVDTIEADASIRAVVLTGEGKAFVAGADISQMSGLSPVAAADFAARGQAVVERLSSLPVPVIAAVNGFALGGGCEIAMACDIVIASGRAKFGQPEVKLGVIPGFGGTQRLVRRVGMAHALDLCLTGRMIDAQQALSMGLVSRVVEGDVVQAALEIAATIVANGPVAVRFAKQVIHDNADAALPTALAAERNLFGLCFATTDQTEGMSAFLEKRAATFTGM